MAMPGRWIGLPLALLLPLVWRAGLALVRLATGDVRLARFAAPGVALTIWMLGVHAVGLATHSFYAGLYVGTALPAALGLWSLRRALPGQAPVERSPWWMWLGVVGAVALMVGPTLWNKHDECLIVGHFSIPAEMQNGVYPPRHLTFPAYELRYHYGIDLAAALVSTVLGRLDLQTTVHLLSLALFGYAFCLYWLVGERLVGGRVAGAVTAACVMFAGGAPYLCRQKGDLEYWTSMCSRGGAWDTPPMPSNFLQHPWSLGLPLFAILLLVWMRVGAGGADEVARDAWTPVLPGRSAWGWALLGIVTAMLSLSQATLFLCVVPTLVFVGALQGHRLSWPKLARYLVWAATMLVTARLLHGFLAPVDEPAQQGIGLHPFWSQASARDFLLWHFESAGALLPLGVTGFFFLRSQRVFLGLLAAGAMLVRDLFKYRDGWDIVKFSMVTQLVLGIVAAAAITAAFSRSQRRWAWRSLGCAGLVACVFFGIAWPLELDLKRPPRSCVAATPPEADQAAIDYLRRHDQAGEGVFRSEHADAYAMLGGLAQPTWDWAVHAFGFSESLYRERQKLIDRPDDLAAFRAQGFRWLVLAPRDTLARRAAEQWTSDGRAERVADFPPLEIYRLR